MSDAIDIRKIKAKRALPVVKTDDLKKNEDSIWAFLNKDIRFGSGLPDKIKEAFYLEFYTLLEAGVDIKTVLELIEKDQKKSKHRKIFEDVLNSVVRGLTFSNALKITGKFSAYEFFSVQIGEETGRLIQVLKELASFFKSRIKQRRQITSALVYPVLVLSVAFGAISFMVSYVVPMFSDIFKRFGSDLPSITKMVLAFSLFIKNKISLFLLIFVSIVAICIWQKNKLWFRKLSSAIILRLPVIGPMFTKLYLSRFSKTMALLTGSKIPLLRAIQLTKQMITFYPLEVSLQSTAEKIMAGIPLHVCLSEFPVYPRKMISMIKIGEEVNQLELFFERIAEQYSNEVEYQTELLGKFLEPMIIVMLGFIVGVILIAMYLPLFKLGQSF